MATVMEFTSPAAEFPLGSVFETLPGATVRLERLVPQDSLIIPYFWVRGSDAESDEVAAAFDAHPGLEDVRLIDDVDGEYLLRAAWAGEYVGILSTLAAADVSLLEGVGTADGWDFEVRGESRDAIGEFRDRCQERDIPIEITAVHELLSVSGEGYELTDAQREALLLAYERGYFDSPRTTTLTELADELGITQQSLSSRLRRGHRRLVASALADE